MITSISPHDSLLSETRKNTCIRSYDHYANTSVTVRRLSRRCEGRVTHEPLVHRSSADEYLAPSLSQTTECALEQAKAPVMRSCRLQQQKMTKSPSCPLHLVYAVVATQTGTLQKDDDQVDESNRDRDDGPEELTLAEVEEQVLNVEDDVLPEDDNEGKFEPEELQLPFAVTIPWEYWTTRTYYLGIKPTCGVRCKNKTRQCKETTRIEDIVSQERRKNTCIRSYDHYAKISVTVRRLSRRCEGKVTHELLVHQSSVDEYLAPSLSQTTECALEQAKALVMRSCRLQQQKMTKSPSCALHLVHAVVAMQTGTLQKDAKMSRMFEQTPARQYEISGKLSFQGSWIPYA
ncbi:hypothetical protein AZE42_07883 [Rhizopogon vesiculosus]|uniref:Uncharacterized protein n=1 Tax=Rhizopogon vesiculosus TaxID=180088 RepID=A0A1J8QA68_9AGAM|nr:hypothetical protein AZE42_07883 [Rhizopogon vesiculosus]